MDDYMQRLMDYHFAMGMARNMRQQGIITEQEYREIDTIMSNKYRVSLDSIFRCYEPN